MEQPKRVRKRIEAKPVNRMPAIEDKPAARNTGPVSYRPRPAQQTDHRYKRSPKAQKPSSVYMRLEILPISSGKSTKEERQEIGALVRDAFYRPKADGKKNQGAFKREMWEPEGKCAVMMYPYFFVRVIDSIIYNYYNNKKSK